MSPAIHVFCGPTIAICDVRQILPAATVHPPVRHGDLLRLDAVPGDVVVIIDGVWQQEAPVRHKEILHLLAGGVTVVGAASMGALRAAELHPYGMIGVGTIFASYRDGIIDADDEVAVAHTADEYVPLSVAMADIQAILTGAAGDGTIGAAEADCLAGHARRLHFTRRTWPALAGAAGSDLRPALARLAGWRHDRAAVAYAKACDARAALHLVAAGELPSARPGPWAACQWGNMFLRDWLARFRGELIDGVYVPFELVLRHQQIYDPGYSRRWRHFVLSWIAGDARPGYEDRALDAVEAAGISIRYLSARQVAYWLTAEEAATVGDREQLARILVRAVPEDLTAPIWPASAAEAGVLLNPVLKSASITAAAIRRNEAIAATGPQRSIWHLRDGLLAAHLAALWDTGMEGEELTAAARDRGFMSSASAAQAARLFYLLATGAEARTG